MKRVLFALLLIAILTTPVWADYPILLFGGEINSIYVGSPQTVTPMYGDELLTNGTFTAWTADNPDSWTVLLEDANNYVTESSGKARLVSNNTASVSCVQNVTLGAGEFIKYVASFVVSAGTANLTFSNTSIAGAGIGTAELERIGITTASNPGFIFRRGGVSDFTVDDVSIKKIIKASTLGDVRTAASSGTFTTAWPTAPTNGHRVGLIICLDSETNPQNFIMASLDGTNAYLAKWVGGTYTNLISSASAFAAGNLLQIVKDGNSVQLWHKGGQILTTQTISDAGVTGNTKFCWFTTNGSLKPTYAQWVR